VVHLDLKPNNVMFRPSGEAVLIDFGLARHGHYPDLLAEELRIPLGNWVYMAPEQILGVRCDPRSDIYALGGMLYELATGQMPFGHPGTVAELRRRLYREPIPPRTLVPSTPEWLQEILLRCLEVDARQRFSTADEVAFALSTPDRVPLTERASRRRRAGIISRAFRRMEATQFVPAPCPPPSLAVRLARVVAVAVAPQERNERLRDALLEATRRIVAADPHCRIACLTVVAPATTLTGFGEEDSPTGRHIHRLIELRNWAKPLGLPEERITYHVLESDKPSTGLLDYVTMNEVDHVLIGAPKDNTLPRRVTGVCAQVAGLAPCTVTVVRARAEG
jgi:nucleotide-binding universal stress UspA family protein